MTSNYEEIVKKMRAKAEQFDAALCKAKKMNDELLVRAEKTLQSITELLGTVTDAPGRKCPVCYTREVASAVVLRRGEWVTRTPALRAFLTLYAEDVEQV